MKNTIQSNARTISTNARGRRLRHTMGSLGALLLLGASALAQNPTGPFSGQHTEGFESSLSLASGYAPNPVLQGNATYHTSWAIQCDTNWTYGCSMSSHGGSNFIGDIGGLMWLDFNAAPSKFGGYFGSNQPGVPITVNVRFLDFWNNVLATDVVTLQNNCTWQWLGWNVPGVNVYRIEFETTPGPGFLMMDDLELDLPPVASNCFDTFCFGDNNSGIAPCPCGNAVSNNANSGCANGTGVGATLSGLGDCSALTDGAKIIAEGLIPNQWALFFEGGSVLPAGSMPFADGVLCVGAPYAGVKFIKADAMGVAGPIDSIWFMGLGWEAHLPGDTSYYQCYYNDPYSTVCGSGWNLTNGVIIPWSA